MSAVGRSFPFGATLIVARIKAGIERSGPLLIAADLIDHFLNGVQPVTIAGFIRSNGVWIVLIGDRAGELPFAFACCLQVLPFNAMGRQELLRFLKTSYPGSAAHSHSGRLPGGQTGSA